MHAVKAKNRLYPILGMMSCVGHNDLCLFWDNGKVANSSKFQVMYLGLKPDQEY